MLIEILTILFGLLLLSLLFARPKSVQRGLEECLGNLHISLLQSLNSKLRSLEESSIDTGHAIAGYTHIANCWMHDTAIHTYALETIRKTSVRHLTNLTNLHCLSASNPKMVTTPIHKPIFIISLGEICSSLIHDLLMLDNSHRSPSSWELLYPLRCSADCQLSEDIEKRRGLAQQEMEHFYSTGFEDLKGFVNLSDHMFERCFINRGLVLLGQKMDKYSDWLESLGTSNADSVYRYYKLELQNFLLSDQELATERGVENRDQQYVINDETHLYFLPSLLKTFPDAYLIIIHHETLPVLTYNVAKYEKLMKLYYRQADINVKQLAARCIRQMRLFQSNLLRIRERVPAITGRRPEEVLLDVKLTDLEKDPKHVLNDVYRFIKKDVSEELEDKIDTYIRENPARMSRSKEEYDNSNRYGYTHEQILAAFSTKDCVT